MDRQLRVPLAASLLVHVALLLLLPHWLRSLRTLVTGPTVSTVRRVVVVDIDDRAAEFAGSTLALARARGEAFGGPEAERREPRPDSPALPTPLAALPTRAGSPTPLRDSGLAPVPIRQERPPAPAVRPEEVVSELVRGGAASSASPEAPDRPAVPLSAAPDPMTLASPLGPDTASARPGSSALPWEPALSRRSEVQPAASEPVEPLPWDDSVALGAPAAGPVPALSPSYGGPAVAVPVPLETVPAVADEARGVLPRSAGDETRGFAPLTEEPASEGAAVSARRWWVGDLGDGLAPYDPSPPDVVVIDPVQVSRPERSSALDVTPVPDDKARLAPIPLTPLTAPYPDSLKGSGVEGYVQVRLWLDAEGQVIRWEVANVRGGEAFVQAVAEAVQHWRFRVHPAWSLAGRQPPVVVVPVRFTEHEE